MESKVIVLKFPYKTLRGCIANLDVELKSGIETERVFSFIVEVEDGRTITIFKQAESSDTETQMEQQLIDIISDDLNKSECTVEDNLSELAIGKKANCLDSFESDAIFVKYYESYEQAIDVKFEGAAIERIIVQNGVCGRVGFKNEHIILKCTMDSPELPMNIFKYGNDKVTKQIASFQSSNTELPSAESFAESCESPNAQTKIYEYLIKQ